MSFWNTIVAPRKRVQKSIMRWRLAVRKTMWAREMGLMTLLLPGSVRAASVLEVDMVGDVECSLMRNPWVRNEVCRVGSGDISERIDAGVSEKRSLGIRAQACKTERHGLHL